MTPGLPSALLFAASDGKHRPASHPCLHGVAVSTASHTDPLVGWRIRAKRIAKGWSQYDLADRLGVSRPAVSYWEAGINRPTAEYAARLREMLG